MPTAAQRFAEWATGLDFDNIPVDVCEQAKLLLLDMLGCGLAAHALGVATEGRSAMGEFGGEPQATVIGSQKRMPTANAAFANAMLCHGLDFDDTHSESVSHISVIVCPAAVAAAEAAGAAGRELLTAVVAGNEIMARVGMSASGAFHTRGFHPTPICGIVGATAAASRLSGVDEATAASALGIAGSFASGILAYLADGTATKPIHPAWAAHGAVLASRLARHGAAGPPSVLEGRFGLYHAFLNEQEVDIEQQIADLGSRWETPRIAYKPYPACHLMHGSLGATAEATAGRRFCAEEIEEVVVTVPAAVVPSVLEPARHKLAPRTAYEAKFSLQYSTAAMLVHGQIGIATYTDEAIVDPHVLELAKRVRYETPEFPTYPQAFPGGVRIRTKAGETLEANAPYQRGSPQNPMTEAEVRTKFRANATLALRDGALDALEDAVLTLDEQPNLTAALAPLTLKQPARLSSPST